jgi:hypothetical protein
MSLFAQLNSGGIRQPDAVINGSSNLLPTSGAGIQLTTAKINQTSNLLGNISPYDYGPGRVSDDIVYKPVPHKIQKIVPQIELPGMNESKFKLSHAVDDGDIAFALRTPHNARAGQITDFNWFKKQHLGRAVDAIVNLPTVNYILAGLQYPPNGNEDHWKNFYASVAVEENTIKFTDFQDPLKKFHAISCFVRDCVRPIGIVIGSENQGGQHQGNGAGAVDWPTDFVVTILVQGLCDNTANHWRCCEISAGDDLMLALAHTFPSDSDLQSPHLRKDDHKYGEGWKEGNFQKPKANQTYTLNHWRYGTIRQTLNADAENFKNHGLVELIPASTTEVSKPWLLQAGPNVAEGVWHIARSQVMASSFARHEMAHAPGYRDDTQNLRGGPLIECQVDPLWEGAVDCVISLFNKNVKSKLDKVEKLLTAMSTNPDLSMDDQRKIMQSSKYEELENSLEKPNMIRILNIFQNLIETSTTFNGGDIPSLQTYLKTTIMNPILKSLNAKDEEEGYKLIFLYFTQCPYKFGEIMNIFYKKRWSNSLFLHEFTKPDNDAILKEMPSFALFFTICYACFLKAIEKFPSTSSDRFNRKIFNMIVLTIFETFLETKIFDFYNFLPKLSGTKKIDFIAFIQKMSDKIENQAKTVSKMVEQSRQDIYINFAKPKYLLTDIHNLVDASSNQTNSFPTEPAQRASVPLSAGVGAGREEETVGPAKGEAASGDAGDGGRAPKAARKGAVSARRVGGSGGSSGARVLGGVRIGPAEEGEENK